MNRAPLTDRLDRFQRAHPELRIAAPWATRSGLWEVSVHGKANTTQYDNGHRMMDTLEARSRKPLAPTPVEGYPRPSSV
jgi:hypothetical protein